MCYILQSSGNKYIKDDDTGCPIHFPQVRLLLVAVRLLLAAVRLLRLPTCKYQPQTFSNYQCTFLLAPIFVTGTTGIACVEKIFMWLKILHMRNPSRARYTQTRSVEPPFQVFR